MVLKSVLIKRRLAQTDLADDHGGEVEKPLRTLLRCTWLWQVGETDVTHQLLAAGGKRWCCTTAVVRGAPQASTSWGAPVHSVRVLVLGQRSIKGGCRGKMDSRRRE